MIRREEVSDYGKVRIKAVTSAYTPVYSDDLILVDATAGAVTITLPDPTKNAGFLTRVKKVDSTANAVTIAPYAAETIDGQSSVVLSNQYAAFNGISDGTNWDQNMPGTVKVITLPFLSAPTAAGYHVFVADRAFQVLSVAEQHSVIAGSGATLKARKITDTSAPGAAAGATVKELVQAAFALDSTINTPVVGTVSATPADLKLASGDRLALLFAGTMTGYVGAVTLTLRQL